MTADEKEKIIVEAIEAARRNKGVDVFITKCEQRGGEFMVRTMLNGVKESTHYFSYIWFNPDEKGFNMGHMTKTIWPQIKDMPEEKRLILKFAYYFWQWSKGNWGKL